jgi:diguanylate cyclase (GGDEF)-like protein
VISIPDPLRVPGQFEPALEAAYQADLAGEKIRVFCRSSVLCSLLYLCFGFLDLVALPSHVVEAWCVRLSVLLATAAVAVAARISRTAFLRRYAAITCLVYLCWGLGNEAIILLTLPTDPGFGTYYAGLLLISMALYSLTYLRPLHAGLTGLALALGYAVVAVTEQHMAEGPNRIVLVQNCFFLAGANLLGMFALSLRERFSRRAFLLKNALARDLRIEEEAKRQNAWLSEHDHLTGLPNRARFLRQLGELLAARQGGATVAVLFLDLDGFKPVNDRHGHAAGDHVLRCVAERLRGAIRVSDLVARLGGDEFVVALPLGDRRDTASVERVSASLRSVIAQPVEHQGRLLRVSASIGMAICPEQACTAEELVHAADQSMYASKRGRIAELAAA